MLSKLFPHNCIPTSLMVLHGAFDLTFVINFSGQIDVTCGVCDRNYKPNLVTMALGAAVSVYDTAKDVFQTLHMKSHVSLHDC